MSASEIAILNSKDFWNITNNYLTPTSQLMFLKNENFKNLFKESRFGLTTLEGQQIEGIIINIEKNLLKKDNVVFFKNLNKMQVTVFVGLKKTVKLFLDEVVEVTIGTKIQFFLSKLETQDGDIILDYKKAKKVVNFISIWNLLKSDLKKNRALTLKGRFLKPKLKKFMIGCSGLTAVFPRLTKKFRKLIMSKFLIRHLHFFNIKQFNLKKKILKVTVFRRHIKTRMIGI